MNAISQEQLRAAVGPQSEYYLRQFERIASSGGGWGVTWNWPAFFLSTAWFDFRGMSGYATLNFFAPWIALGLMAFAGVLSPHLSIGVLIAYPVLLFVVVPMYANALYLRNLRKRIARASARGETPSPPTGRSMVSAVFVGAFTILVPTFVLGVAQTAYVDYIPRSQVSEAVSLLSGAKTPIAEYRADTRKWPDKVEQVVGNTSGKYTERLEITAGAGAASGTVTITATMKATGLNSAIAGKTVQLSTEDGKTWTCRRGAVNGVEDKYLPAACRH